MLWFVKFVRASRNVVDRQNSNCFSDQVAYHKQTENNVIDPMEFLLVREGDPFRVSR